jgi:hypothetical protein
LRFCKPLAARVCSFCNCYAIAHSINALEEKPTTLDTECFKPETTSNFLLRKRDIASSLKFAGRKKYGRFVTGLAASGYRFRKFFCVQPTLITQNRPVISAARPGK